MEKTISDKANIYYSKLKRSKKLEKQWRRPLHIYSFMKLLYAVIFICTVYFSNQYIKSNYDTFTETIIYTMFSIAIAFALCGVWALLLKPIMYFIRKSMLKKHPYIILQQQEVMQLKYDVIDSFKKAENTTLVKPYDGCLYPAPLKEIWKENERILFANTGLLWRYDVMRMKPSVWIWFYIAFFIALITVVTTIAIVMAFIIFVVGILFAGLCGMFATRESRYYYESDYEKAPKIKYKESYGNENKKSEPNERAVAKAQIRDSKKKIKETKKLLQQWGIEILDI